MQDLGPSFGWYVPRMGLDNGATFLAKLRFTASLSLFSPLSILLVIQITPYQKYIYRRIIGNQKIRKVYLMENP